MACGRSSFSTPGCRGGIRTTVNGVEGVSNGRQAVTVNLCGMQAPRASVHTMTCWCRWLRRGDDISGTGLAVVSCPL